ncbi:TBC1D2 protein [Thecamonas trahens ATCC 50062]|uniref:TBC1D2 protein n=1 Tax=Thecamonas trahens ATCC 50062 TaxID=461836 RepID=A0A0L0DDL3_THETB|nr:TBC1D2 protein [Thecamonas trahens ATCC 50062]KNC50310.1 TBC1D2 protein [Thecamonas trahens ATCC 50062]|eukprot:XP_013756857.1 TBC1D2 protein [Thecamonas trahens ATCC 50062]
MGGLDTDTGTGMGILDTDMGTGMGILDTDTGTGMGVLDTDMGTGMGILDTDTGTGMGVLDTDMGTGTGVLDTDTGVATAGERTIATAGEPTSDTIDHPTWAWNYGFVIPPPPSSLGSEPSFLADIAAYTRASTARSRAAQASPSVAARAKAGFPREMRPTVWRAFIGTNPSHDYAALTEAVASGSLGELTSTTASTLEELEDQIAKDSTRTFPGHPLFTPLDPNAPPSAAQIPYLTAMRRVLLIFAATHPAIGYCQGLNYIAAALLSFATTGTPDVSLEAETLTYDLLCALLPSLPDYHGHNLLGFQVDVCLAEHDLPLDMVVTPWLITLFTSVLPLETTARMLDCFICITPLVVLKTALALFLVLSPALLAASSRAELMELLRRGPESWYDADELIATVFSPVCELDRSKLEHFRDLARASIVDDPNFVFGSAEPSAAPHAGPRGSRIAAVRRAVEGLVAEAALASEITDASPSLLEFCQAFEAVMRHGFKDRSGGLFSRTPREFWEYVEKVRKYHPHAAPTIKSIAAMSELRSPLGRARAWIRAALVEARLEEYLVALLNHTNLTKEWYADHAVLRSHVDVLALLAQLARLSSINFALCARDVDLDSSWRPLSGVNATPAPARAAALGSDAVGLLPDPESRAPHRCPLCGDRYAQPKMLDCLHSFCALCLISLVAASVRAGSPASVACPECSVHTALATSHPLPKAELAAALHALLLPGPHRAALAAASAAQQHPETSPARKHPRTPEPTQPEPAEPSDADGLSFDMRGELVESPARQNLRIHLLMGDHVDDATLLAASAVLLLPTNVVLERDVVGLCSQCDEWPGTCSCKVCGVRLCKLHARVHHKITLLSHRVLPSLPPPPLPPLCPIHPEYPLALQCMPCAKALCGACVESGRHAAHHTLPLTVHGANARNELTAAAAHIAATRTAIVPHMPFAAREARALADARSSVTAAFATLRAAVDAAEARCLASLETAELDGVAARASRGVPALRYNMLARALPLLDHAQVTVDATIASATDTELGLLEPVLTRHLATLPAGGIDLDAATSSPEAEAARCNARDRLVAAATALDVSDMVAQLAALNL